ncbi:MAG: hypothetical protein HYR95_01710, partial [Candidatus Colwellbacteria bacterium]|nr:hypothetical protein [Candidatus Colwellbacteria bacterium]
MKNRLEIQVIRKIIGIVLASVVLSGLTQFAQAAATQFNVSGTDLPTLQVTNATKYPYSNGNWGKTVYADPGDALDFIIFYHNSSIATALNTRLKINLPPLVSSGNSITANVFADNAVDANGAINVYLNYGSNLVLTFVPGSLKWYVGNPAVLK